MSVTPDIARRTDAKTPKAATGRRCPPPNEEHFRKTRNEVAMAGKKTGSHPGQDRGEASWSSFWEITDPETAALCMVERYGAFACPAVTECMVAALTDDRQRDYQFWSAVLDRVGAIEKARREAALAFWAANGLETI